MMRTRIKVCGMTRKADVELAVSLGVDAIGMILHANSPRTIDSDSARALRRSIPSFVNVVGVFVNAPLEVLKDYVEKIGLDTVQLHGEESAEYADSLGTPYIRAIRAKTLSQVNACINQHQNASGVLLDPFVEGMHGGTGEVLDQSLWPGSSANTALILAGGLSPNNIEDRLSTLNPYAVDVNSGVESGPGKKNHDLLSSFVENVRKFDLAKKS